VGTELASPAEPAPPDSKTVVGTGGAPPAALGAEAVDGIVGANGADVAAVGTVDVVGRAGSEGGDALAAGAWSALDAEAWGALVGVGTVIGVVAVGGSTDACSAMLPVAPGSLAQPLAPSQARAAAAPQHPSNQSRLRTSGSIVV
jgi:hypothetical protein